VSFRSSDTDTIAAPLRFYLATDERNATALACFRSEGAVFASDLLTAADRRELAGSWSLVFTDVVAVLEQEVLARSGTFYGHAMSSFVGASVDLVDVGNGDGRRLTGPALCPLLQAASSIDALHSARTAGRPSWTEKDRAIPSPFAMPCVCLVVVERAARPRLSAVVCPPERELNILLMSVSASSKRERERGSLGVSATSPWRPCYVPVGELALQAIFGLRRAQMAVPGSVPAQRDQGRLPPAQRPPSPSCQP
jgi:hypothetical protein